MLRSDNASVVPGHNDPAPVMADGVGLTVNGHVVIQPVGKV